MDALMASYGGDSSDESDSEASTMPSQQESSSELPLPLPPPPISLLNPQNSLGVPDYYLAGQPSRIRNFPHIEGNYALHVYIPVYIPPGPKKEMAEFLKRVSRSVPGLHVVNADAPIDALCRDVDRLEHVALGREFHVSLGRTVPIRVLQIDSVITMLRQKLQRHRRFWIDFSNWEIFVNDDRTRTFLAMEVTGAGLAEIRSQIQAVNEVYRLHNLPEFYMDPRPHISVTWAADDVSDILKNRVQVETRVTLGDKDSIRRTRTLFSCKFGGVECKIGNKTYKICTVSEK